MRRLNVLPLLIATCLGATLGGCSQEKTQPADVALGKDYSRPLPEGASALRRITDPNRMPDFRSAWDERDLFLQDACGESVTWFDKPSTVQWFPANSVDHDQARASVVAFRELLRTSPDFQTFHDRLLQNFDVYESVGCDDRGTVLFTGYYSPTFKASRYRRPGFTVPLYGRPTDLVTDDVSGEPRGRRLPDGSLVPWPNRRDIESSGILDGTEVVWLQDPLSAYVVHVNGSARLKMLDGSDLYLGYAGKTDRPYTGLGATLVERGLVPIDELGMPAIRRLWKRSPHVVEEAIMENDSYVFFQEYDGGSWPAGSLGFPVTARRSIATDKTIYPRGGVVLVDTEAATFTGGPERFTHFMLDQDTGGAIRAPGRCDLYLGTGPMAEILAGRQFSEGNLFYLFLKDDQVATVNADWASPVANAGQQ
ncbi:MAG: MltA domain-containing protein [Phycisphaerales bacterium]|nr:MltA domain-containing protein [Phycisphaerales bacterium]